MKTDRRPLSWRAKLLLAIGMVALPVLLVAGTEVALRVLGYGNDTRFLLKRTIAGAEYWVTNFDFYQQFLTKPVGEFLDLDDLGFQVPCRKGPDVTRILLLGDSAIHGCTPDTAFGFSRFLDVFLRAQFPERSFEICNAACPAINSFVMRCAARSCAALEPDVVIVYMGNNEFIGPFGPGVTGAANVSGRFVDVWVALQGLRIVQWAGGGSRRWLPGGDTPEGIFGAFARFRHDSPEREAMRLRYRENVESICGSAREAGAKVLLCTVASNLQDWPPFDSLHGDGLDRKSLQQWEQLFAEAQSKEQAGDLPAAIAAYEQANAIDAAYAEAHYGLGRVLARREDHHGALSHLGQARDYDALPLRVDGPMNEALRAIDGQKDLTVADVDAALSPESIPGRDLFWDFVHFNFHGTYLFAREVFGALVPTLSPSERAAPLSEEECRARLGYSDAVRLNHARRLLPAFSFWGVSEESVQWLEGIEADLARRLGPDAGSAELAGYQRAAELCPEDYRVRQRAAEIQLREGQVEEALTAARALVREFPWRCGAYRLAAAAAERAGRDEEAAQLLAIMGTIFPDSPQVPVVPVR